MGDNQIRLSIVVPCFNEQANVREIVFRIIELLKKNMLKGEIVLVDDGSTDGTSQAIAEYKNRFKDIICIKHSKNLGIAEAWYSGLQKSQGHYVLTIDADLQYKPEDIIELYREIEKGDSDLVQGWRKEYRDNKILRRFLSRAFNLLLNAIFFTKVKDIKSGFVIYKRNVFADVLKERTKYRAFQHFVILVALKKGYRFKQIPINFYPRFKGGSFIIHPIFFSLKSSFDIPRAIWELGIISSQKKGINECAE